MNNLWELKYKIIDERKLLKCIPEFIKSLAFVDVLIKFRDKKSDILVSNRSNAIYR